MKYILTLTGCQGEGETLVLFFCMACQHGNHERFCLFSKTLVCDEEQACSRLLEVVLLLISVDEAMEH